MRPESEPRAADGASGLRAAAAVERVPWWARLRRVPWIHLALALALLAKLQVCQHSRDERDCRRTAKEASNAVAVLVCRAEYERERDPQVGAILAEGLRRNGDWQGATAMANELLAGPARADALWVLGRVAVAHRRFVDGQRLLQAATSLYEKKQEWGKAAQCSFVLGGALKSYGKHSEALLNMEKSLRYARLAGDQELEGFATGVAARVLSAVGLHQTAIALANQATDLIPSGKNAYWPQIEIGNALQEAGSFHRASVAFERAMGLATSQPNVVLSLHLELADVFTETGDLDLASEHLADAAHLDQSERLKAERLALEGRLWAKRGDLEKGASLLEQARSLVSAEDLDELHDIEESLAVYALARGNLQGAERWARKALVRIDRILGYKPPPLFGASAVDLHRKSHETLFTALARSDDGEGALRALHHWRAQMLFTHLTPGAQKSDLEILVRQVSELQAANDVLAASASRVRSGLMARMSQPPLLALVVAGGDLWRLTVQNSHIEIKNLGLFDQLSSALLDRFRTHPTDRDLARRVGQVVVPPAFSERSSEPLRVFLDDALTALPVEAMRTADGPALIALRPIVRILLPLDDSCSSFGSTRNAAVIADPFGDLPAANAEAIRLGTHLGLAPQVGASASVTAVKAAANVDFLHLAVHGDADEVGGLLRLHDGTLRATELVALQKAPRRVVLATCSTAIANRGHYSMATSYLAAGSEQVLATLRPVTDSGAAQLLAELYRNGVPANLPLALAKVQADLADSHNPDWPSFVVVGHPTCTQH